MRSRAMMKRALRGGIVSLLIAGACTNAQAVPTCTVASSATLSFGPVVALASSADVTSNSGGSFWINCTSDVAVAPRFYSATPRTLVSGSSSLPFALSAVTPGGAELPTSSPGASSGIATNGTNQTVTLHGKLRSSDFRSLPSGLYSRVIALTIEY
jgi:spore coat protein U-like protein